MLFIIIIIICSSIDSILYLFQEDKGWAKWNAHLVYTISYLDFKFIELRGPFVTDYILVSKYEALWWLLIFHNILLYGEV